MLAPSGAVHQGTVAVAVRATLLASEEEDQWLPAGRADTSLSLSAMLIMKRTSLIALSGREHGWP